MLRLSISIAGALVLSMNMMACVTSKAQSNDPPSATTSEAPATKFISNPRTMQLLKNKLDGGH
ncbi:MAG: hypothetical protein KBF88_03935 [Polyangiaceae bacterium]|nr:hypothetical protein [Polyangiaceae bacterium]